VQAIVILENFAHAGQCIATHRSSKCAVRHGDMLGLLKAAGITWCATSEVWPPIGCQARCASTTRSRKARAAA